MNSKILPVLVLGIALGACTKKPGGDPIDLPQPTYGDSQEGPAPKAEDPCSQRNELRKEMRPFRLVVPIKTA